MPSPQPLAAQNVLLPSQANDVLSAVRYADFDPADFAWDDRGVEEVRLTHKPTGYYFDFFAGMSHSCAFSPGDDVRRAHHVTGQWRHQIKLVQDWLGYLRREYESPDLWAAFRQERSLVEAAAASEGDDGSFEPSELRYVRRQLLELKQYVLQTQQLTSEQADLVTTRFNYLENAALRQTKADWLHTFTGVLLSLALRLAVSSDGARELFQVAGRMFAQLVSGNPTLIP